MSQDMTPGDVVPTNTEAPPAKDNPTPIPGPDSAPEQEAEPEPALPPLTPQEFRIYNRLAEQMEYFMYTTLHTACTTNRRPAGMSLKQFIDEGLRLARYLEMHHSIEETHLYPLLGRKMPEFRATSAGAGAGGLGGGKKGGGGGGKKRRDSEECELLRQHRVIHEGMDETADYLRRCKERECELELGVLKAKMDSWGDVLLQHLDQEVRDLGAEKMRRHFTVQEMKAIPM
ncbi:hypothetical protein CHGG_05538 [Chaetomium globosum CBS 148.51]|uniref:Uncharacterized protein n=1 Tax=Chaetomium globosum (strain ATCC 6205 / CBS 148.51 / DSM 1962 / NBRC 6347 / NRRL 1970) TaxID=306901 RepID=Q2H727_CHAGB|nr:uncharacterized protein CHGG_05538 [Chaetomium globosum CBS 148.51]EAQ88919.1 hypothetical protein CHGG_05538 [Chaetomium globosum CBS 148.51]